jgi:hypothetical protein
MARRTPQTQAKRQREFAKAEKRRGKEERRVLRKALKSQDPADTPDTPEDASPDSQGPGLSASKPLSGSEI